MIYCATVGKGYTVNMKSFSIAQAYKKSWSIFKTKPLFFTSVVLMGIVVGMILSIPATFFKGVLLGEISILIVNTILSTLFTVGLLRISLKAVRGQATSWKDFHMTSRTFWMFVWVGAVTGFLVFLGLIALIIPGIILAIAWIYVFLLLIDHPQATTKQLLRASAKITKGVRWRLLGLAFVHTGVGILGLLALIVGVLPASMIIMITTAFVYDHLKKQTDLTEIFPSHQANQT